MSVFCNVLEITSVANIYIYDKKEILDVLIKLYKWITILQRDFKAYTKILKTTDSK